MSISAAMVGHTIAEIHKTIHNGLGIIGGPFLMFSATATSGRGNSHPTCTGEGGGRVINLTNCWTF